MVTEREIESYERNGAMLPVARVIYPTAYVNQRNELRTHVDESPWPEIGRLREPLRYSIESEAAMTDEELIHCFDREMGQNELLKRPILRDYQPWNTYLPNGKAEHYYSHWQVHQVYLLARYPLGSPHMDMFKEGGWFDALSFWTTLHLREQRRTLAKLAINQYGQNQTNIAIMYAPSDQEDYHGKLRTHAETTRVKFGLSDQLYFIFLQRLIDLHDDYRRDERYRLASALERDIYSLTGIMECDMRTTWDEISDRLEHPEPWRKRALRQLDINSKERDDARDVLTHNAGNRYSKDEIESVLDYCADRDLPILVSALSGMISNDKDYAEKMRRVTRYTNLKNVLTGFEYFARSLVGKKYSTVPAPAGLPATLTPIVIDLMGKQPWFAQFKQHKTEGTIGNLNRILSDNSMSTPQGSLAREFLITCVARNLSVHDYPSDDQYYGDLFGEMLSAAISSILFSWRFARTAGWV